MRLALLRHKAFGQGFAKLNISLICANQQKAQIHGREQSAHRRPHRLRPGTPVLGPWGAVTSPAESQPASLLGGAGRRLGSCQIDKQDTDQGRKDKGSEHEAPEADATISAQIPRQETPDDIQNGQLNGHSFLLRLPERTSSPDVPLRHDKTYRGEGMDNPGKEPPPASVRTDSHSHRSAQGHLRIHRTRGPERRPTIRSITPPPKTAFGYFPAAASLVWFS